MNVGDPIYSGDLEFVKATLLVPNLPRIVAEWWFVQRHPDVAMNCLGETPSERPIKSWEPGYGVVVAESSDGRPVILFKTLWVMGGDYSLWIYKED